ncbi:unnamed protein product [Schistocephalus solidus]|uniref:FERM domain-containing protein n=1 Tax=Schistocephalus solidus TaxID=70667 RepID=A0A183SBL7_SCHSO|nr:unnamed protein product [Schistocephalus solidus]
MKHVISSLRKDEFLYDLPQYFAINLFDYYRLIHKCCVVVSPHLLTLHLQLSRSEDRVCDAEIAAKTALAIREGSLFLLLVELSGTKNWIPLNDNFILTIFNGFSQNTDFHQVGSTSCRLFENREQQLLQRLSYSTKLIR